MRDTASFESAAPDTGADRLVRRDRLLNSINCGGGGADRVSKVGSISLNRMNGSVASMKDHLLVHPSFYILLVYIPLVIYLPVSVVLKFLCL